MRWRNVVNKLLSPVHLRMVNIAWGPRGVHETLRRIGSTGIVPSQIVDVGAHDGRWCRRTREIFPEARWLLVDPLPSNVDALRRLTADHPNVQFWEGAIGSFAGHMSFNTDADRSSLLSSNILKQDSQTNVEIRTLDSLLEEGRIDPPELISLDIQGYELEALRGATRCLKTTQILLIRLYFRRVYNGLALAHEVIAETGRSGFRIFDICTYLQRSDSELAFSHVIFAPETSPLFRDEGFL